MKTHKSLHFTILLLAMTFMRQVSIGWTCPSSLCTCQLHNSRMIIRCSDNGWTTIPEFTSDERNYDELTLANNDITFVPNDAFKGLKIKYLDLSNNPISRIDEDAFSGLAEVMVKLVLHADQVMQFPTTALSTLVNLQHLELKGFAVTSLPENALASLSKLQTLTFESFTLDNIRSTDFASQQSTLLELNLPANALTSVPSLTIASLPKLISVNLAQNQIAAIGSGAFDGAMKLKRVDMSGNGVKTIHQNAFTALAQTLTELRLQRNHLHDREILPLTELGQLQLLDLGYNGIANIPTGLFANMQHLEEADFTKNNLSNIKKSTFVGLDSTMKILKFAENQIVEIESNAFEQLSGLEELYLDEQPNLSGMLDERTFSGLEQSLKRLGLNKVKFLSSNWEAVESLGGLQLLQLAHNNIASVPDSTFLHLKHVATLDMSYNAIVSVSQKAMYGLKSSLKSINLENNNITTLDMCVFYQFRNLETIRLKGNPLNCDCRLRWLRTWLERYTQFELFAISWKCASPSKHKGVLFPNVSPNSLTCDSSMSVPTTCDDLESTTTTTTTSTTPSTTTTPMPHQVAPTTLFVTIGDVKDTSMTVTWFVNGTEGITGFTVSHQVLNTEMAPEETKYQENYRSCSVTGLDASTRYMICVTLWYSSSTDRNSQKACEDVTTKIATMSVVADDSPRMQIILGSILGVLVLIVIVSIIVVLIVRCQRRRETSFFSTSPDGMPRPRVGYNSRRFSKPKTNTVDIDNQSNKQLEKKLEGFTEEERNRILSVLTQPSDFANTSRVSDSSQRYVPELPPRNTTTDGYLNPVSLRDEQDPHIYFEIPADSIPTDCYI